MNCEELFALLHDYVGGELVVEVRESFEVHFNGCERCGPLPPAFEARLRAALKDHLPE